jgi:large subunit ribosomal protein L18
MAPLVRSASRFLFPCTVEYSLLCAVILGVMWMNACSDSRAQQSDHMTTDYMTGRVSGVNIIYSRSVSQFSVDCTSAHKGLFAGILVLVLSIVSLIMFFELVQRPRYVDEAVLQVSSSHSPHKYQYSTLKYVTTFSKTTIQLCYSDDKTSRKEETSAVF